MTDIVDRLRDLAAIDNYQTSIEAADEITRLRAENERLRAALEPVLRRSHVASPGNVVVELGRYLDLVNATIAAQPAPGKEEA